MRQARENPLSPNEKIALGLASAAVVAVGIFAFSSKASAATPAPAPVPSATRVAVNFTPGHRYQLVEPTVAGSTLGTVALVQAAFDASDPGTFHVVSVTPAAASETVVVDVLQQPTIVWALPLTATATDLGLTPPTP